MSNFLAIATVTATLKEILLRGVQNDVPGSNITTERPDNITNGMADPRVNIYLYQVTPNAALRNMDLPTRDRRGQLVQCPRAALDLHYLLTVYGEESSLVPQRLLGSVVRTLHEQPILARELIEEVKSSPEYKFLATSNLANEVELVKFTPTSISLEELSKLWSVFFQIPYALSTSYQATVVLIESEKSTSPALPILERKLFVQPFRNPVIDKIIAEEEFGNRDKINTPILYNSKVLILGKNLSSRATRIQLLGAEVEPQAVSDTRLDLDLTQMPNSESFRSGVKAVQVVHRIPKKDDPTEFLPFGFESNVGAFVLQPKIEGDITYTVLENQPASAKSQIVVEGIQPIVGKRQRGILILSQIPISDDVDPKTFTFAAEERPVEEGGPDDTDTLIFRIKEQIPNGTYLIRIQVDGAESPLVFKDGAFTGPILTIGQPSPPEQFTLTLKTVGSGGVAVQPPGDTFDADTEVKLTATPEAGFAFSGWSDDLTGNQNPTTLIMDGDRTVTATFAALPPEQFSLQLNVIGLGQVEVQPPGDTFEAGTEVQLTAIPGEGFAFTGWSGGAAGTENPITVIMDADKNITANFAEIPPAEMIVHEETQTGGSSDSDTVATSNNLTAVVSHLYLAAISTKPHTTVDGLTGLGLAWTRVREQCSGRDQTGVEVWMAQGTPTGDGVVTARLSDVPPSSVIAVSRYSGVDSGDPTGEVISGNTNGPGGGCSGGTDSDSYSFNLTTTVGGAVVHASVALRNKKHTPGEGYTERSMISEGSGGDVAGLVVLDKEVPLAASIVLDGSTSGNTDWAVLGLEIRPATAVGTVAPSAAKASVFSESEPAVEARMKTIQSKSIKMSAEQKRGKIRVQAEVEIKDDKDKNVSQAAVKAVWQLPESEEFTETVTQDTDENGIAKFNIEGGDGVYLFKILDVMKSGYDFDKSDGEIEMSYAV